MRGFNVAKTQDCYLGIVTRCTRGVRVFFSKRESDLAMILV